MLTIPQESEAVQRERALRVVYAAGVADAVRLLEQEQGKLLQGLSASACSCLNKRLNAFADKLRGLKKRD